MRGRTPRLNHRRPDGVSADFEIADLPNRLGDSAKKLIQRGSLLERCKHASFSSLRVHA